MKDFYYILGLDPNCSLDEIKEAYRKLSKKLHPDLNQGDDYFESRFRDIKEAFETLREPQKRRIYDEALNKFKSAGLNEEPQMQASPGQSYHYTAYNSHKRSHRARPGRIHRKGPGIGLSITLIALAAIMGVYLFRWFTGAKAKSRLAYAYTDTTAALQPVRKKHKHKHSSKTLVAARSDKKTFDTGKIVAVKTSVMKPMVTNPQPVEPPARVKPEALRPLMAQTRPDSNNKHSDYLYVTFVHPNVTGVVPLRAHDRFNADIIAAIPANSRVFVLERGATYYRVVYDNNIGFVPRWALHQK